MNFTKFLEQWGTLLISILTLLVAIMGGGWLKDWLSLKRERNARERERERELLENFLRPMQGRLNQTLDLSRQLVGKLRDLEYSHTPGDLEEHFASLPDSDIRKHTWRETIGRLHEQNRASIELIDRFYGRKLSEAFRKICDKFKLHAVQWEDVWNAMQDVKSPTDPKERRYAKPVPGELAELLKAEIAEVERRAGNG